MQPRFSSSVRRSIRLRVGPRVLVLLVGAAAAGIRGADAQDTVAAGGGTLPNIVLILADDMGYGDIRAFNEQSRIPTPHLDALAAEGIRFTDAHSPSAVCTPTRYGLLTGRYAWRTPLKSGVLWGYSPLLIEPRRTTLASLLGARGYATAAIGKWHLGLGNRDSTDYDGPLRPGPNTLGFHFFFGIPASLDMEPYVFIENERVLTPPTGRIGGSKPRRSGGEGFWRAGPISPGFRHMDVLPVLTDRAMQYLESQSKDARRRPFFLYLPLTAPHTPWMPTEAFAGTSGAGPYGDFAAQVDAVVGAVTAKLDRLGLRENTLVIFTSDNGAHWLPGDVEQYGHRANGSLRGQKADIWEGGHRVPFVARWPGRIPAGAVSDETISLTDLLATVAAVVGTELPRGAGEDSYNILPAMLGRQSEEAIREAIVHHSLTGVFAIRQGPWKLVPAELGSGGFSEPRKREPTADEPGGQLYNLAEDPGETRNLYRTRPEVVACLSALLQRYRDQGHSRPSGGRPASCGSPIER